MPLSETEALQLAGISTTVTATQVTLDLPRNDLDAAVVSRILTTSGITIGLGAIIGAVTPLIAMLRATPLDQRMLSVAGYLVMGGLFVVPVATVFITASFREHMRAADEDAPPTPGALTITQHALLFKGATIPLEDIAALPSDGNARDHEQVVLMAAGEAIELVPRCTPVQARLIREYILGRVAQRQAVLRREGHDLSAPASAPAALHTLLQQT